MRRIAREWLEAASLDIENISHIIQNERLTGHVAFHAQQAIEKSLKAVIEEKGLNVPKIHSLQKLFAICESSFIDYTPDEELIIALDSLYIESRYPGEFGLLSGGKPNQKQAQAFYDFAFQIHQTIKLQLEVGEE
jgi:HEPN domain-containing protein